MSYRIKVLTEENLLGPNHKVGCYGIRDNKVVFFAAFFEDGDTNRDGKVGLLERFMATKNEEIMKVVRLAAIDNLSNQVNGQYDPEFVRKSKVLYAAMFTYMTYSAAASTLFGPLANKAGTKVSGVVLEKSVKSFFVRKAVSKAIGKGESELMKMSMDD